MIWVLALATTVAVGPGLKLGPRNPDGTPVVLVLDERGRVATRVTCPRNDWIEADDMAAALIGSTEVAATVVRKNGRVTLEDLGPAKHHCVVLPPAERDGEP